MSKSKTVGLSDKLREAVNAWAGANCPFPAEVLVELKQALLTKNFRAAAESLSIENSLGFVKAFYDEARGGLCFAREWEVKSKGPPLARTLIYRFLKRKKMGDYYCLQWIPLPPLEIMEAQHAADYYGSSPMCAMMHFYYDYFYFLREEEDEIIAKLTANITRLAEQEIRSTTDPFRQEHTRLIGPIPATTEGIDSG